MPAQIHDTSRQTSLEQLTVTEMAHAWNSRTKNVSTRILPRPRPKLIHHHAMKKQQHLVTNVDADRAPAKGKPPEKH